MPIIEENFNESVLTLIGTGENQALFSLDPTKKHFIRMAVYDADDNLVAIYRSDSDWNGNLITYNNNLIPFDDDESEIQYPYIENVQLPLYKTDTGKFYVKPNDTLSSDTNYNYIKGFYKLKFDFLSDVFSDTDSALSGLGLVNPRFIMREISTSRLEVRLLGRHNSNSETIPFNTNFIG